MDDLKQQQQDNLRDFQQQSAFLEQQSMKAAIGGLWYRASARITDLRKAKVVINIPQVEEAANFLLAFSNLLGTVTCTFIDEVIDKKKKTKGSDILLFDIQYTPTPLPPPTSQQAQTLAITTAAPPLQQLMVT